MQVELLEAKTETFGPLGRGRGDGAATSPGTGGLPLRRVCAAWGMARSSFYAMTSGGARRAAAGKAWGPKPAISDQALLVAIEADLEASPRRARATAASGLDWVCRDIRVARKRVLRLMRENNLLSPHRCRRSGGNPHDGRHSCPEPRGAPMAFGCSRWTTAGAGSSAVEHWNAECGWHAPATEPISMMARPSGAGLADGVPVSGPLPNQIKFWGSRPTPSSPSPRPTASPSGSIARWEIIHGRIYRIAEQGTLQCPVDQRTATLKLVRGTPRSQSGPPRETNFPSNRVRYSSINRRR